MLKFIIFTLRNASSQEGFKEKIEHETLVFDQILNNFFIANDIEILYELTWVLINVTYTSNKFHSKLLKTEILNKLYEKTYDKRIIVHIFWIFNNLIANDISVLKIITNTLPGLKQRLKDLIKTVNSLEVRKLLMETLCTFLEKVKNTKNLLQVNR